jgi:hypothetical protein
MMLLRRHAALDRFEQHVKTCPTCSFTYKAATAAQYTAVGAGAGLALLASALMGAAGGLMDGLGGVLPFLTSEDIRPLALTVRLLPRQPPLTTSIGLLHNRYGSSRRHDWVTFRET